MYFWDRADPQIKGGICHKQSLIAAYEHLWKWDTALPMWSSNEDEDPWAQGSKAQPAVGFERKFASRPENLTSYRFAGNSHALGEAGRSREPACLAHQTGAGAPLRDTSGMVYEDKLPLIQGRLRTRPPAR